MAEPRVSQQNIAQSITLPQPACLLHIVHPGAMCSPGKRHTYWPGHPRDSSDQATFFYFSVVQFWCSLPHPDWSLAIQPHMQQTVIHCVLWHLSIRTKINFFNNLSNRSVGADHLGQPSFPTCISEPWPPMTLSPVHHCSYLRPLLIDTDLCRPGTPHTSWSFGDAVTQSSCHLSLVLIKCIQILVLAHFSCFQHIIFENNMFTC